MKKSIYLLLVVSIFFSISVGGKQISSFNTSGYSGNEDTINATNLPIEIKKSQIYRGNGLSATSLTNSFNAYSWETSALFEDAVNSNSYIELLISVNPGYSLSLSEVILNARRSPTGPDSMQWMYSTNGVDFDTAGQPFYIDSTGIANLYTTTAFKDKPELQFIDERDNLYLRLYAWNASNSGGTAAIGIRSADNLILNGNVERPLLAAWDADSIPDENQDSLSPRFTDESLTASAIRRGPGLNSSGSASNTFIATQWSQGSSLTDAKNDSSYFEIMLRPDEGMLLSPAEIDFHFRSSAQGPDQVQLNYALDGESFSPLDSVYTITSFGGDGMAFTTQINEANLQNLNSEDTLTLRLYAWGASSASGTAAFGRLPGDDLSIRGSLLCPLAEPASSLEIESIEEGIAAISWETGENTAGSLVKLNVYNDFSLPYKGYDPQANNIYQDAGQQVVYFGSADSTVVTGLAYETYYFRVFTYNCPDIRYQTAESEESTSFYAQVAGLQIETTDSAYLIDFDQTVPNVNSGQFSANGFLQDNTVGSLDALAWSVQGADNFDLEFGDTVSEGRESRFTQGISNSGVGQGGIYAFEVESGNHALGIKPTGSVFTEGHIRLRIQNRTGELIESLDIGYLIYNLNRFDRSNLFNFAYSTDNETYQQVDGLSYFSPETQDSIAAWNRNIRFATIDNLSLNPGDFLYLKWTGDDVSGTGARDEFALDDILIIANPVIEVPEILSGEAVNIAIAGETELSGNLLVEDSLHLNDALIYTNAYNIELDSTAVLIKNNYSHIIGELRAIENINSYEFNSFGNIGLELTSESVSPGLVSVKRFTGQSISAENHESIERYFIIEAENNGNLDATLSFQYHPNELNGIIPSDLRLFRSTDEGQSWELMFGVPDTTQNRITVNGIDSFSYWTAADINEPLPVRWLYVDAEMQNEIYAKISWATASELQNKGFYIQRHYGDENWKNIGFKSGEGNSNQMKKYVFDDKEAAFMQNAVIYYRLKQVDYNGSYEYSKIVSVRTTEKLGESSIVKIAPNPASTRLKIISQQNCATQNCIARIKIRELTGRILKANTVDLSKSQSIDINKLSPGVYHISVKAFGQKQEELLKIY